MLDFLYYPVSAVMWFWHQAFGLVLGPSSGVAWALSVVFLALTLRALMIKPVLSQMRSAQRMRRIAPQLAELKKRHGTARRSLRQQQPASDPQTAQVAEFMKLTPWLFPLGAIVGGLFFPFPIAILVYWLTSNAWTLGQQHVIGRVVAREQPPAAVPTPAPTPARAPRPGQKPIRKPGATAARVRPGA
ncbi:hypothetical protein LWC33_20215 [Pseudonocardia sp. RS11V-5]|uniref:YidC/Oxa1 family membrane protein insertase n=1 Tax=Pseudonocardia terrae TaxID=2905831 RepID=UPI001E5013BF|nr:hypothetical protein [Pseudonocardia terrae]MCE3553769.1 hypothetical protein [Pseudonocardia terrae]